MRCWVGEWSLGRTSCGDFDDGIVGMLELGNLDFFDADFERFLVVDGLHGGSLGRHVEYGSMLGLQVMKVGTPICCFIAAFWSGGICYVSLIKGIGVAGAPRRGNGRSRVTYGMEKDGGS